MNMNGGEDMKQQFKMVELDKIDLADFNPAGRTKDGIAIRKLVNSIKERGVGQPVPLIPKEDGRYLAPDGNRRITASKMAGLKEIPAIVHYDWKEADVAKHWQDLNRHNSPLTSFGWMETYYNTAGGVKPSVALLSQIKGCIEVFKAAGQSNSSLKNDPLAGLAFLIDRKVSPCILNIVLRCYNRFVDRGLEPKQSKLQIGMWMIRHGMQSTVKTLLCDMDSRDIERLHRHIVKDTVPSKIKL